MAVQETPFFFPSGGRQLYGVLHAPATDGGLGKGIVMVEPFGEEKLWAQRLLVNFARELAGAGCWTLRFDCRGHGDSEGNSEEATVTTRVEDTLRAVEFLRRQTGVPGVVLHGARFGGTVAALAAGRCAGLEALILWSPVVRCEKYFQECLRSNLATQMAQHKKIIHTREVLVRQLLEGRPVNIDGYLVSSTFYREMVAVNLDVMPGSFPVLAVQMSKASGGADEDVSSLAEKWRSFGRPVTLVSVPEEPFWRDTKRFVHRSENLFDQTVRWLASLAGNGQGAGHGTADNLS